MKTKSFILIVFLFALIFGASCKKKVIPAEVTTPVVKEVVKITQEQFILNLGERTAVKNLEFGNSIAVSIDPDEVLSPSDGFAIVGHFKPDLTYAELSSLLKKIPLTVVWVGEQNSHLLVMNYFDLRDKYNSDEEFLVLYPKPMYHIVVGSKEYWVSSSKKFWKTW